MGSKVILYGIIAVVAIMTFFGLKRIVQVFVGGQACGCSKGSKGIKIPGQRSCCCGKNDHDDKK